MPITSEKCSHLSGKKFCLKQAKVSSKLFHFFVYFCYIFAYYILETSYTYIVYILIFCSVYYLMPCKTYMGSRCSVVDLSVISEIVSFCHLPEVWK